MPASEPSLAETSAATDKSDIAHSSTVSPLQGAQADPGQVEAAEAAPGTQNTPPNADTAATTDTSLEVELRTSLPPSAAAADTVSETERAKDLNVSKVSVVDGLVTQDDTDQSTTLAQGSRRSSRAAAAVANAGMARQAQEEERPLGILLPTGVGGLLGASKSKKRSSEPLPAHESKRTKAIAGNTVSRNTLEMESEEPRPQRGKKRRQARVFEAPVPIVEASPIITDLPPLPFTTTSPELRLKGKKTKNKAKKPSLVVKEESDDSRHCEFCKKAANICVLMHCHACRRVYHSGCFVHAFKPFVEENVPILSQMERLQLEAPERRGNIFRCASCKAAFIDFYESGGYLWDCQCPTCSQPEKAIYYRQRKLVQMMNDMELEKQRKKENKGKKQVGAKSGGKTPAATPSRLNSVSRGRRTRGSVANKNESKDTVGMKAETTVEPMDVDEGEKQTSDGTGGQKMEVMQEKANDALKEQPMGEPEAQPATPQKESQLPNVKYEPIEELKLSGDELVKAVAVEREDEHGHWCFPVICSRTSSLRASGVMKRGNCKWSAKKVATIHCECCDKKFSFSEFVHHTDSSLVQDPKCAQEDPMPFLFVEHRDNTLHTPLEDFLPDLRSWVGRQSANNTPTKVRKGRAAKQEGLAAVMTPTTPDAVPETSLSRLRELALFKRPKHRTDKTSLAARLVDAPSFEFLAEVVCLSPKYVMNMANGSLADRVVRSKTSMPDDSFPRKVGWLVFNRRGKAENRVTCVCCEKRFLFDEFVAHAGISLTEHQKRARQFIYVVEKLDKAVLIPFLTFAQDLSSAATAKVLELYLGELHPPPREP